MFYLKDRVAERQRESSIWWFTPQMVQQLGLDQVEGKNQNSILVSYMDIRGSCTWAIICGLPKHISRKLNSKQNARSQTRAWMTHVLQAVAVTSPVCDQVVSQQCGFAFSSFHLAFPTYSHTF